MFNILSLFDGISGGQVAINRLGIKDYVYYASEVDKYAIQITQKNYPKTIQLGDVRNIKGSDLPKIDLLIGGSPCNDLSVLKDDGEGLKGKQSSLFYEFLRLKNEINPKYFLLENVIPRKKEWKKEIDELMQVEGILINSDLFIYQNRPRIYWTNIEINNLPERPNWDYKFYQYRRTYFRENKSGVCPCLTANMGTGGHNVPLKSKDLKDKLTPVECERLQTFPDNYTEVISNSQRYKALGNSFTVDVIKHILSYMES